MLMSLGQRGVVQTFTLGPSFEASLCLLVVKSGLLKMLGGVVVMMGNFGRHRKPGLQKMAPRDGGARQEMIPRNAWSPKELIVNFG
jgi:hypothetical protein